MADGRRNNSRPPRRFIEPQGLALLLIDRELELTGGISALAGVSRHLDREVSYGGVFCCLDGDLGFGISVLDGRARGSNRHTLGHVLELQRNVLIEVAAAF